MTQISQHHHYNSYQEFVKERIEAKNAHIELLNKQLEEKRLDVIESYTAAVGVLVLFGLVLWQLYKVIERVGITL